MKNSTFDLIDPDELIALDMLHDACEYVRNQWDVRTDRAQAKANLDARAILFNCSNRIFEEAGCGITRAEMEGAAILERGA